MSQFAVNQISPASGAEGFVSTIANNQVAKAQIAAQERMNKARIEAEAMLQRAQLDATARENQADREARSADYARLNESNERMQRERLAADQAADEAKRAFEREMFEKTREIEDRKTKMKLALEAELMDAEAGVAAPTGPTDDEIRARLAEKSRLEDEQASLMVMWNDMTRRGEFEGRELREQLQATAAAAGRMRETGAEIGKTVVASAIEDAVASLPGLDDRAKAQIGEMTKRGVPSWLAWLGTVAARYNPRPDGRTGEGGLFGLPIGPAFADTVGSSDQLARMASNETNDPAVLAASVGRWLAPHAPVPPGSTPDAVEAALTGVFSHAFMKAAGRVSGFDGLDDALRRAAGVVSPDWLLGVLDGVNEYASAAENAKGKPEAALAGALGPLGRAVRQARARLDLLDLPDKSDAMARAVDRFVVSYGLTGTVDQFLEVARRYGLNDRKAIEDVFDRVAAQVQGDKANDIRQRLDQIKRALRDFDIETELGTRRTEAATVERAREVTRRKADVLRRASQTP